MTILNAENICKTFSINNNQKYEVLKGINLAVPKGEFLAIMGPSGVGKSTLLYILGSLDKPDSGEVSISIDGSDLKLSSMKSDEIASIRNRYIGFVFQFHHLLPEFSTLENVMMPALIAGTSYNKARNDALELMEITGVADKASNKPSEVSGGEQQRIAIARALINKPQIVFADEPTGNLDSANAKSVINLIIKLKNDFGLTFVIATHSDEIASEATRILRMHDGRFIV